MFSVSHLDLLSLRIFVLAAHTRSLTGTAERVHMTLSAVSRRVSGLEELVGETLFERTAQGLALTGPGEEFLRHARAIVAGAETLVRSMDELSKGVHGRVRIWANTSAVVQFLPRDLFAFRSIHPHIHIDLEERLSRDTLRALQSGDIDLGIVADDGAAVGLLKEPYRQDQLVAILPDTHPLAGAPSLGFAEIAEHDLVAPNQGSAILRRLDDLATSQGKVLKIQVQATSFEAILSLVEAGHGLGVLPRAAVSSSLSSRRLASVAIHEAWASRRLSIAYRDTDAADPDVVYLLRFLADRNRTA